MVQIFVRGLLVYLFFATCEAREIKSGRAFPLNEWTIDRSDDYSRRFEKLTNYLFDENENFRTDSIFIVKNGKLLLERYEHGYRKDQTHRIWSISKSVTALLVGIAIEEGKLSLDSIVDDYYPQIAPLWERELKLSHLMHMASGLDYQETYESNPVNSDVVDMLYISNHEDMASFTASRPFRCKPGDCFNYSSGETNLIMGILKKVLADEYEDYPWTRLFDPLGITTATWQRDFSGTFVGSSYLFLSPGDLARIGLLVLRKGNWRGKQILRESFVDYLDDMTPAFINTRLKGIDDREAYGAQWWLNVDIEEKGVKRALEGLPENLIIGSGHHGQGLFLFPDEDAILVRMASDKEGRVDKEKMLKLFLKGLKGAEDE